MSVRQLTYARARALLLVSGVSLLGLLALGLWLRRVDPVEVYAALLFIPVFLGFMLGGAAGGLVAGAAASLAYLGLRSQAIRTFGADGLVGLHVSRTIAYLVFGGLGGTANQALAASLDKLDLYDEVDSATGLGNARMFLHLSDLEVARASRYQTFFSVARVGVPASLITARGRKRRQLLRDLGRLLQASVRTVDKPFHGVDADGHHLGVLLPETGPMGAEVFTNRLAGKLAGFLTERGCEASPTAFDIVWVSFPEHAEAVQDLRDRFAAIDRVEHPETADTTS